MSEVKCGYGVGDNRPCWKAAVVQFYAEDPRVKQMIWFSCAEHETAVRTIFERRGQLAPGVTAKVGE